MSSSTGTSTGNEHVTSTLNNSTSYSETYEPRIKPEDAIRAAPHWQYFFLPNISEEVAGVRCPYYEDPNYKDSFGLVKDPYHMTTEEFEYFQVIMENEGAYLNPLVARYWREAFSEAAYAKDTGEPRDETIERLVTSSEFGLYTRLPSASGDDLHAAAEKLAANRKKKGRELLLD